jgi:hypothetical protein
MVPTSTWPITESVTGETATFCQRLRSKRLRTPWKSVAHGSKNSNSTSTKSLSSTPSSLFAARTASRSGPIGMASSSSEELLLLSSSSSSRCGAEEEEEAEEEAEEEEAEEEEEEEEEAAAGASSEDLPSGAEVDGAARFIFCGRLTSSVQRLVQLIRKKGEEERDFATVCAQNGEPRYVLKYQVQPFHRRLRPPQTPGIPRNPELREQPPTLLQYKPALRSLRAPPSAPLPHHTPRREPLSRMRAHASSATRLS